MRFNQDFDVKITERIRSSCNFPWNLSTLQIYVLYIIMCIIFFIILLLYIYYIYTLTIYILFTFRKTKNKKKIAENITTDLIIPPIVLFIDKVNLWTFMQL